MYSLWMGCVIDFVFIISSCVVLRFNSFSVYYYTLRRLLLWLFCFFGHQTSKWRALVINWIAFATWLLSSYLLSYLDHLSLISFSYLCYISETLPTTFPLSLFRQPDSFLGFFIHPSLIAFNFCLFLPKRSTGCCRWKRRAQQCSTKSARSTARAKGAFVCLWIVNCYLFCPRCSVFQSTELLFLLHLSIYSPSWSRINLVI